MTNKKTRHWNDGNDNNHKTHYTNPSDSINNFHDAMREAGVICNNAIVSDGEIHRFAPSGKGEKDGWYVYHGEWGSFGICEMLRGSCGVYTTTHPLAMKRRSVYIAEKLSTSIQDATLPLER